MNTVKKYRVRKWIFNPAIWRCGFGDGIPTLEQMRDFEQLNMGCGVMSESDVVNHYARRNQNKHPDKIGENRGTQLYPCKVYDKNMKLVRVIGVDEVQASVDASYDKTTWQQKAIEYKNRHGNAGNRGKKK
tara:strand:+ start:98 stop:490 length:393 start_codon:yes stop_codon:yes gene_type:complete